MSKKLLEQFGVYFYFGSEIGNFKDLGLNPDKIYQVKKDGDYVREMAKQLGTNDFYVYENKNKESACAEVLSHFYNDGILLVEISIDDERELAPMFSATAIESSGEYMGIPYDLVLTSPVLDSVHLVERKRTRIDLFVD